MKKIRNGRNPRYQEALNLAQENNVLAEKQTDHNFQTVLNLANIDSEIARMGGNLKKLVNNVIPRNDRLTDAYIKLANFIYASVSLSFLGITLLTSFFKLPPILAISESIFAKFKTVWKLWSVCFSASTLFSCAKFNASW